MPNRLGMDGFSLRLLLVCIFVVPIRLGKGGTMSQYSDVTIRGQNLTVEWEGEEASGDGWHGPIQHAAIGILGACGDDGDAIELSEADKAEAVRQIEKQEDNQRFLDHMS